jgi:hypothetical protein
VDSDHANLGAPVQRAWDSPTRCDNNPGTGGRQHEHEYEHEYEYEYEYEYDLILGLRPGA